MDHIITLTWLDNRVWFRNYQLTEVHDTKSLNPAMLQEIGPRFVLNPIKIFAGSFCGAALWENPHYVSPNIARATFKARHRFKYANKLATEEARAATRGQPSYHTDDTDEIFR